MARQTLADAAKAAFKALAGAGVVAIRVHVVRNISVEQTGSTEKIQAEIELDSKTDRYTIATDDAFGAFRTLTYFGLPLIEPGKQAPYGKCGTIVRTGRQAGRQAGK